MTAQQEELLEILEKYGPITATAAAIIYRTTSLLAPWKGGQPKAVVRRLHTLERAGWARHGWPGDYLHYALYTPRERALWGITRDGYAALREKERSV